MKKSQNMSKLQVGLVLGAFILIQILYFGFDTVQLDKEGEVSTEELSGMDGSDVNVAIEDALSHLSEEDRDSVSVWMERGSEGDLFSYKQLSSFWVSQNDWRLAGHFTEAITEIQPTVENYTIAANTYATGAEQTEDGHVAAMLSHKAIEMYEQAIAEGGSAFELELQKVMLMIKVPDAANPMKGVLALVDLSEKYPEEPEVFRRLGEFSIQTGQWDKAQERLERAYKLDPDHKKTICLLSTVYAETGDQAKSAEFSKLCDEK